MKNIQINNIENVPDYFKNKAKIFLSKFKKEFNCDDDNINFNYILF